MNMQAMGGPVGGGAAGAPMNAGTPSNEYSPEVVKRKLNTAIYDYLLRNSKYDLAKSFFAQMDVEIKADMKESPSQRQANGDDGSDDDGISKRPDGLPLPNNMIEGPFLQDWWCQFWEIWQGLRGKGKNGLQTYLTGQRMAQRGRFGMMGNVDPNSQNMRAGYNMMQNNGVAMGQSDLRKSALQQGNAQRQFTNAQIHQMKAQNSQQNPSMMQGNAMERQGSQMDGSGPRSGSPGSGDGPSSPKRQRVEGGMQQMGQGRPGPAGQMQGNQGMNQNMGPGGAQGSPMNQAGMDGVSGEFYANVNGRIPMPQNAAGAANQGGGTNGNHALQDYQMQLMLLEQQNKKRLLMARQEQDMAHPAGVGPNGQFAPGMSPQGSQRGVDPSANPEMRPMIDPNSVPPNMRQMVMGANGAMMRPPSSHPMAGMTPEQLQAMRQQGMQVPNGQFPGGQPPGQIMPGQGAQPGQAQALGTPRQQNTNMPPPPAPQGNATGTQPSSPSQQPPPTPNTTSKAKTSTKKEPANKKGAANKKAAAGATATTESEQPPTPTPATPATPMNANSFAHNQNKQLPNGQAAGQPGAAGNATQAQTAQQAQATANAAQAAQPPSADMPFGSLPFDPENMSSLGLDFNLDSDALENFDFDSFLNADGDGSFGLDTAFAFDGEIGLDGGN